eukprot:5309360-Prymnesium_polylepis.2
MVPSNTNISNAPPPAPRVYKHRTPRSPSACGRAPHAQYHRRCLHCILSNSLQHLWAHSRGFRTRVSANDSCTLLHRAQ